MAENFYTILTAIGKARIANAQATGIPVQLTQFAVGDGLNDSYYEPTEAQTVLKDEKYRASINQISVDSNNPNCIVLEGIIPTEQGGFTIREVGIFDNDNNLIAIGKYPATYKPQLAEGSGKDLYIRMISEVSNISSITLKIDPAIVLASRKYVTDSINTHNNSASSHANLLVPMSILGNTPITGYSWIRIAESLSNQGLSVMDLVIKVGWDWYQKAYIRAGINKDKAELVLLGNFGENKCSKVRILYNTTYTGNKAYLEVYSNHSVTLEDSFQFINNQGWTIINPVAGEIPAGYTSKELNVINGLSTTGQIRSDIPTGSSPLIIASTTKVTNLNVDQLDGYHAGHSTGQIPVSDQTVNTDLNADMVDGIHGTKLCPYDLNSANIPATSWFRYAESPVDQALSEAMFKVISISGVRQISRFTASINGSNAKFGTVDTTGGAKVITKARIVYNATATGNKAYLELYSSSGVLYGIGLRMIDPYGWTFIAPDLGAIPSGYTSLELNL